MKSVRAQQRRRRGPRLVVQAIANERPDLRARVVGSNLFLLRRDMPDVELRVEIQTIPTRLRESASMTEFVASLAAPLDDYASTAAS